MVQGSVGLAIELPIIELVMALTQLHRLMCLASQIKFIGACQLRQAAAHSRTQRPATASNRRMPLPGVSPMW